MDFFTDYLIAGSNTDQLAIDSITKQNINQSFTNKWIDYELSINQLPN